jgi:hypothetical protein
MKAAPAHHIFDEQAAAGERELLRHGQYHNKGITGKEAQRALTALEPRLEHIRAMHAEPFDPEEMPVPGDTVRDLLLYKYAATQAKLGVPIYKCVGWAAPSAGA